MRVQPQSSDEESSYDYYMAQIDTTVRAIKDIDRRRWELNSEETKLKSKLRELTLKRNQCTPPKGSRVQKFIDKIVDGFLVHCRSVDKSVTRDEVLHFAENIIDYDRSAVDWGWDVAPGNKWFAILLQYKCTHDNTREPAHWHGSECIHEVHYPYDQTAQKWAEDHRFSFSPERIAKVPSFASFDKKTGSYEYHDTDSDRKVCTYYIDAVEYVLFFALANQLKI